MGVDCAMDCLTSNYGKKLLYHAVKVKKPKRINAGRDVFVKVTQTKEAKSIKVTRKNDKLLMLVGVLIVLGPEENKIIIPVFRVRGTSIQFVANVCQISGVHVSVLLRNSGDFGRTNVQC